ncbi:sulfur carrier protein ThiS [Synechococcus sp. CCY 9618]|uniref:sulfur carrier protein ThiS n=1 Tax=Synechococcus sp. CCY 9618 TaxID=2815602 RepID=UPI001C24C9A8|nr:sulfur carrier protein ThiS [Synechococcus sp. CCY 9618]
MRTDPQESGAEPPGIGEIRLQVNGEERRCPAGLRLDAMLLALGYQPRLVVVEFNGKILGRHHWSTQEVVESDVLEVVTIVGGGS